MCVYWIDCIDIGYGLMDVIVFIVLFYVMVEVVVVFCGIDFDILWYLNKVIEIV